MQKQIRVLRGKDSLAVFLFIMLRILVNVPYVISHQFAVDI